MMADHQPLSVLQAKDICRANFDLNGVALVVDILANFVVLYDRQLLASKDMNVTRFDLAAEF